MIRIPLKPTRLEASAEGEPHLFCDGEGINAKIQIPRASAKEALMFVLESTEVEMTLTAVLACESVPSSAPVAEDRNPPSIDRAGAGDVVSPAPGDFQARIDAAQASQINKDAEISRLRGACARMHKERDDARGLLKTWEANARELGLVLGMHRPDGMTLADARALREWIDLGQQCNHAEERAVATTTEGGGGSSDGELPSSGRIDRPRFSLVDGHVPMEVPTGTAAIAIAHVSPDISAESKAALEGVAKAATKLLEERQQQPLGLRSSFATKEPCVGQNCGKPTLRRATAGGDEEKAALLAPYLGKPLCFACEIDLGAPRHQCEGINKAAGIRCESDGTVQRGDKWFCGRHDTEKPARKPQLALAPAPTEQP